MTTTIKDEFVQRIATEDAWKSLSEEFAWTEALLEKHRDDVDWKEISGNTNIIWTIPMLRKFANRLDWDILSEHIGQDWFTEAHLEAFKDKWDWAEIASAWMDFSEELIEKYADYWDWNALIGEGTYSYLFNNNRLNATAFYEKYKGRIPKAKLQDSDLWKKMVEERAAQLKQEMLS